MELDNTADARNIKGMCGDNCITVKDSSVCECPNYKHIGILEMFSNFSLEKCLNSKFQGEGRPCVK